MEGKDDDGGDVKAVASSHHRRQSQKELVGGEPDPSRRRSTLVMETRSGEDLSGNYRVLKGRTEMVAHGAGQQDGEELDASAGPKHQPQRPKVGRSGTITIDPSHSEELAKSFRVVSRASDVRSVKSRSDSMDESVAGGQEDDKLATTADLKSTGGEDKAAARAGRGRRRSSGAEAGVKAEAKDGEEGGAGGDDDDEKKSGLDASLAGSMTGSMSGSRGSISSSFHPTAASMAVAILEGKDEDNEEGPAEGGELKEDNGMLGSSAEWEGRRDSTTGVKSSFILSFDHGLSLDQSMSNASKSPTIDTPGKLTGVRRGRPDPLMMSATTPTTDLDAGMAISLKFNSPADTDYSFGEMTMRTLNNSTAAETVAVRSPSDTLVRDFSDFERYYDMNSIQVLAEDVQGAQGRVYRIMKRPLAFQQPSSRLANANQRRDSGSSWVVVKECTQNAKLDALCFPRREWTMIRQLAHPHVIRLADTHIYNQGDKYRIVMEEMDCNLQQLMKKGSKSMLQPEHRLPVPLALEIVYLIGLALHHLNSKLVVFLDLKPDNILCTLSNEDEWELARDSTGRAIVKLTDFGTCKFIGGDERHPPDFISVGTPGFQSPESRQDRYTTKADVFSLGCVLYTLVTGMVPFAGLQANDEMVEDTEKLQLMLDKVQQPGIRALLARMLCWQPRRRLSMDKVLHDPLFHPFLRPGDIVNEGPLDEQVAVTLAEITVNIQLLDISTLHDPSAVVLSTAYENSLADTRRTATSYAAALMAALEVPTLTKFGEEFEWFEPLRGLRGRDVRIVQMGRKDKRPFGNLGAIWMALFRNRDSKSRFTLIQMYQFWRLALPDVVTRNPDLSKLYIGFLGVSRAFTGVSNSRVLRQMVVQELLSLAEFAAISPDMPPGQLRTILLYEWKYVTYSLFMSELSALCLECTLGFMGDDLLALFDGVLEKMGASDEAQRQSLAKLVDALRTALTDATQEFCSALAFSQVCRTALEVGLELQPRWRRHEQQLPMIASPHAEMEDREVLEDAIELLDYLGERARLDEDMLIREGEQWLIMCGELDARRALVCLSKIIPPNLRPRNYHSRKTSVDSHGSGSDDEAQPNTPQRGLTNEAAEARRRSSSHRTATGEQAKEV